MAARIAVESRSAPPATIAQSQASLSHILYKAVAVSRCELLLSLGLLRCRIHYENPDNSNLRPQQVGYRPALISPDRRHCRQFSARKKQASSRWLLWARTEARTEVCRAIGIVPSAGPLPAEDPLAPASQIPRARATCRNLRVADRLRPVLPARQATCENQVRRKWAPRAVTNWVRSSLARVMNRMVHCRIAASACGRGRDRKDSCRSDRTSRTNLHLALTGG